MGVCSFQPYLARLMEGLLQSEDDYVTVLHFLDKVSRDTKEGREGLPFLDKFRPNNCQKVSMLTLPTFA